MNGKTSKSIAESALEDGSSSGITDDQLYRVFADPVRRTALAVLDDTSTPTSLETLAYGIESDPEADVACVDACSVALHHRHLPILDEAGLVDYDPPTNTIRSCHGSVQALVD
ncbi:DUF7344 domain-containing protein [Halorubrum lacusprofundi]|jgi:hypothetical protein|uniref:DUF7344 domain-containing protein n=1 Tax=Halorubrum lacusprofundi (strain ATCC 49239 / DSM 5036 / JCM 8891 / ACAM 34) TaxID=416348 RepID=B9LX00_HALLT|nr:hypothetical protein [Halorubrum lacusprofundi]ACM58991.1 hypothetical protein Hlac_3481 [Halorubrum lacusprofundi ATCC 49239]MCG1007623.1 hypothetical protein [Halorubrum lacusprofundi]